MTQPEMTTGELRMFLQHNGLSQNDFARLMRVQDRTARRWVAGKSAMPEDAVGFVRWVNDVVSVGAVRDLVTQLDTAGPDATIHLPGDDVAAALLTADGDEPSMPATWYLAIAGRAVDEYLRQHISDSSEDDVDEEGLPARPRIELHAPGERIRAQVTAAVRAPKRAPKKHTPGEAVNVPTILHGLLLNTLKAGYLHERDTTPDTAAHSLGEYAANALRRHLALSAEERHTAAENAGAYMDDAPTVTRPFALPAPLVEQLDEIRFSDRQVRGRIASRSEVLRDALRVAADDATRAAGGHLKPHVDGLTRMPGS